MDDYNIRVHQLRLVHIKKFYLRIYKLKIVGAQSTNLDLS